VKAPHAGVVRERKSDPGATMLPALARSLRTKKASSVAFGSRFALAFAKLRSLPNRYENHIAAAATNASAGARQSRNLKKKRSQRSGI
jgi:hypothetical protein